MANRSDYPLDYAFYEANQLAQSGRHAVALTAWEDILERAPDNGIAHHARGFELTQLGRADEALAALDRTLELEPYLVMAGFLRVAVLAALDRREEASAAFEELPSSPLARDSNIAANKAAAETMLGWLDDALDSLTVAFEADFASWWVLETHPYFEALRNHSDFRPRLDELVNTYRRDTPAAATSAGDANDSDVALPPATPLEKPDTKDAYPEPLLIAGSAEQPETVAAATIAQALAEGRRIDLQHVVVTGAIESTGASIESFDCFETRFEALSLEQATVTRCMRWANVTCTGPASFDGTVFDGLVSLAHVTFAEQTAFSNTRFLGSTYVSASWAADVDFSQAEFLRKVVFSDCSFGGAVTFQEAAISGLSFHKATFHGDVSFDKATIRGPASFSFSIWPASSSFADVRFENTADFQYARFRRANFRSAEFVRGGNFRGARFRDEADFMYATCGAETEELRAPSSRPKMQFDDVVFARGINFVKVRCYCEAGFTRAQFRGKADFGLCYFREDTGFAAATFFDEANFVLAYFAGTAGFPVVDFRQITVFRSTVFDGAAMFQGSSIRDEFTLSGCQFADGAEVDCSNVSGFMKMKAEWAYDPTYNGDEEPTQAEIARRGLKGHVRFNEVFLIALVKNYRELGWYAVSDDTQFWYRSERRKRLRAGRRALEFLFLELTFGYGMRPYRLIACFAVACAIFAGLYATHLSDPVSGLGFWNQPVLSVQSVSGIGWSLLHSVDVQTPGINLNSLADPVVTTGALRFDAGKPWVLAAQRLQQIIGWYFLALFLILFNRLWLR